MGVFGLGLIAVAGGVAYKISRRPGAFEVQRSATLSASPEAVYGLVNDFHQWPEWSPWENLDPDMNRRFAGAESGVGAIYSWSGNRKAGAGTMTITESVPQQCIRMELKFTRPMVASNQTEFRFEPTDDGVVVTWSMRGEHDFMGKAYAFFVDLDKMIGKSFENGLRDLERAANGKPAKVPANTHETAAKPS